MLSAGPYALLAGVAAYLTLRWGDLPERFPIHWNARGQINGWNLITNSVVTWRYRDPRVRLKLPVRVSYQSDPELAMHLMLQATTGHPRVITDPAPVARLMSFGDHGIDLELRFWIPDPQEGVNNVRSDVNRAIWRLFKQHGIVIPVAQREVRLEMVSLRVGEASPARDD